MGQSLVIAIGLISVMLLSAWRVLSTLRGTVRLVGVDVFFAMSHHSNTAAQATSYTMTAGDFVLVQTFMLQLFMPLSFLGTLSVGEVSVPGRSCSRVGAIA
jgi:ABC-type transport system involved in Fe-S cluster assembly fused permease/ATPase subunit